MIDLKKEGKRSVTNESDDNVKVHKNIPKFFVGGDPRSIETTRVANLTVSQMGEEKIGVDSTVDEPTINSHDELQIISQPQVEAPKQFQRFKAVIPTNANVFPGATYKTWNKMPGNRRSRSTIHKGDSQFTMSQRKYFEQTNSNFKPISYLINDFIKKDFEKQEQQFLIQNSIAPLKGPNGQEHPLLLLIKREQDK